MRKAKNICNEEILVLENMQDYEKLKDGRCIYLYFRKLGIYCYMGIIVKSSIKTISFNEDFIELNDLWFDSDVAFVVEKEDLKEELKDE